MLPWSTVSNADFDDNMISPDENLLEFSEPIMPFLPDMKPHDIIEQIMDGEFIINCIDATNEHGEADETYVTKIGAISRDEKGISFVRGFLAIKLHLKLLRLPQMKWAWSEDPLRCQPEVKK